jgi:hypothetical protein
LPLTLRMNPEGGIGIGIGSGSGIGLPMLDDSRFLAVSAIITMPIPFAGTADCARRGDSEMDVSIANMQALLPTSIRGSP